MCLGQCVSLANPRAQLRVVLGTFLPMSGTYSRGEIVPYILHLQALFYYLFLLLILYIFWKEFGS
jgi:hypothetical protein